MLGIIGLVIVGYIAVLLTILILKLNNGIQEIKSLNQIISTKLKTKYEIINEMSITEARIKYIRAKSIIFEIIEEAGPLFTNMIAKALGGKSSGGYREGG